MNAATMALDRKDGLPVEQTVLVKEEAKSDLALSQSSVSHGGAVWQ